MGGSEEGVKFKGIYDETQSFYLALFGKKAPKNIWEPTDERFSPSIFGCSNVNLQRVANFIYCQVTQSKGKYLFMNTLRRRFLAIELLSKSTDELVLKGTYNLKYTTPRREHFITARGDIRRDLKIKFMKEKGLE